MEIKEVLWLEDQYEELSAYRGALFRAGYIVEPVESVSEAEEKLKEEDRYVAYIFDIKVLPGNHDDWRKLDVKRRTEDPDFDPYLGLELLKTLLDRDDAEVKRDIRIDANKVIVFSVVYDKKSDIEEMGVPEKQILYKAACDLTTIPKLIRDRIEGNDDGN